MVGLRLSGDSGMKRKRNRREWLKHFERNGRLPNKRIYGIEVGVGEAEGEFYDWGEFEVEGCVVMG